MAPLLALSLYTSNAHGFENQTSINKETEISFTDNESNNYHIDEVYTNGMVFSEIVEDGENKKEQYFIKTNEEGSINHLCRLIEVPNKNNLLDRLETCGDVTDGKISIDYLTSDTQNRNGEFVKDSIKSLVGYKSSRLKSDERFIKKLEGKLDSKISCFENGLENAKLNESGLDLVPQGYDPFVLNSFIEKFAQLQKDTKIINPNYKINTPREIINPKETNYVK